MPRPYQNMEVERFPVAFAQTISWMPPGDGVNVLFDGRIFITMTLLELRQMFFMESLLLIMSGKD